MLFRTGHHCVYMATAAQIPVVMHEISRLREMTFRASNAGTGHALDIDVFDSYQEHLFLWDEKSARVIGACRLGMTDKILPYHGLCGLYSNTLFKCDWEVIEKMNPAIEISRSFVRQDCPHKQLPLLLLWKGIGTYVAKNPRYQQLFGAFNIPRETAGTGVPAIFKQYLKMRGRILSCIAPRNPESILDILMVLDLKPQTVF